MVETQRLLGFRKVRAVLSILSQQREEEARRIFFCIAPKLLHVTDHKCGNPCFGKEWQQPWSCWNLVEFSHLVFSSRIARIDIVRGIGGTWGDPACFLHAAYRRTKHGLSKWVHITNPEDGFIKGYVWGRNLQVLRNVWMLYCQIPSMLWWHQAQMSLLSLPKQGLNARLQVVVRGACLSNRHFRWIKS